MLKDRNGCELRVGDIVMVPGVVIRLVEESEEFYNVTIETTEPMYPASHSTPIILNAKQLEKPTAIMLSPSLCITETDPHVEIAHKD